MRRCDARDIVVVGREEVEVAFKGEQVLLLDRVKCANFEYSPCVVAVSASDSAQSMLDERAATRLGRLSRLVGKRRDSCARRSFAWVRRVAVRERFLAACAARSEAAIESISGKEGKSDDCFLSLSLRYAR